jgi:hypothetical protein
MLRMWRRRPDAEFIALQLRLERMTRAAAGYRRDLADMRERLDVLERLVRQMRERERQAALELRRARLFHEKGQVLWARIEAARSGSPAVPAGREPGVSGD